MPKLETDILVVAHSHPAFSKGGVEVIAFNLFREYQRVGLRARLLTRTPERKFADPKGIVSFDEDQDVVFTEHCDWFDTSAVPSNFDFSLFEEYLVTYQPKFIHIHHYLHLGVEIVPLIRRVLPASKIVFTFHEFIALCANKGQMLTTDGELCFRPRYEACATCFKSKTPSAFFLRERYFKRCLRDADHFVSPSQFLASRYIDWGLNGERFSVIENGQPYEVPAEGYKKNNAKRVFAYFGQLTPFKGIDVLLDAISLIPQELREQIEFRLYGVSLDLVANEYVEELKGKADALGSCVRPMGRYESSELTSLYREVEWCIVPSIWWENSPMVIQEAFSHQTPVIASDIGGMAEKITHGHTGLLFKVGNAAALSSSLIHAITHPDLGSKLASNIEEPISISECVQAYLELFEQANHCAPVA